MVLDERTTSYGQTVKFLVLNNTSGLVHTDLVILSLKTIENLHGYTILMPAYCGLIFLLMTDE